MGAQTPPLPAPRIALGLGDNIDYEIVWDARVLEALIGEYAISASELTARVDGSEIRSERALVLSILGFVKSGIGGERFVATSSIVDSLVRRFTYKVTLGGTSVRAAIAMRVLGHRSALHLVTINDHVRRLFPQDSAWVCSNDRDTLYPHLIVQFDEGARVCAGDIDIRAPRANRIIYVHDLDNIEMRLDERFSEIITDARVLLISGYNAMQSETLLADRLATLKRIMQSLPDGAQVFYEDAAFHDLRLSQRVWASLIDKIDIYSLNEDELQTHLGRPVDLLNAAEVAQALIDLQRLIPVRAIIVHTMFWALAYGTEAARFADALKGGITMATTRFRYGDDFTPADYAHTETLAPIREGARFAAEIESILSTRVCCIPVADVAQVNATTIGLGDAFVGGFLPHLAEE